MPVTPDLKPDEFELTILCPIGVCIAQHTYAFSKELKNHSKELKTAKENIIKFAITAHKEGKHNG